MSHEAIGTLAIPTPANIFSPSLRGAGTAKPGATKSAHNLKPEHTNIIAMVPCWSCFRPPPLTLLLPAMPGLSLFLEERFLKPLVKILKPKLKFYFAIWEVEGKMTPPYWFCWFIKHFLIRYLAGCLLCFMLSISGSQNPLGGLFKQIARHRLQSF